MTHYDQALRSYDELIARPTFRDFVCVYIADGCKRDRRCVALASADPDAIRLAHRWIRRLSDLQPSLTVRYTHEQSREELRQVWSDVVGEQPETIRARRAFAEELQHACGVRPLRGVLTVSVDDVVLRARGCRRGCGGLVKRRRSGVACVRRRAPLAPGRMRVEASERGCRLERTGRGAAW